LLRGSAILSSFKRSNSGDRRTIDIDWLNSPLLEDDVLVLVKASNCFVVSRCADILSIAIISQLAEEFLEEMGANVSQKNLLHVAEADFMQGGGCT